MSWISQAASAALDLVPVVTAAANGVATAIRDRKRSPAERLAQLPRPVDAGLRAALAERRRQADEAVERLRESTK